MFFPTYERRFPLDDCRPLSLSDVTPGGEEGEDGIRRFRGKTMKLDTLLLITVSTKTQHLLCCAFCEICSLATQALERKDDRRQCASLPRPVVEVRVPRGPSAVEGERQLLVVLVFLAPHPKGGEHDLRTVLRFRTTRRSRAGAARGGGTPSSTSKVPGSSARRRT